MKVTKVGTPPGERVWVGRCQHCGSEAEAKENELIVQHEQRDGSFARAKCPVCDADANGSGGMMFYPRG